MTKGRDPIVWVIQESWSNKADLSSARRYGTIRFMLTTKDSPAAAPGPCLAKIRRCLAEYQPGDFFCYTLADPASILLLGLAWRDEGLDKTGPLQWLRWERERDIGGQRQAGMGYYVPSSIHL